MKKYVAIIILFMLIVISLIFILFKKDKYSTLLNEVGNINDYREIKFIETKSFEDTYELMLNDKSNEYLDNSLVEAIGVSKLSNNGILLNINAYFDFKDMIKEEELNNIILRRGYLTEENSKSAGVDDHKMGYDLDVYLDGHSWTDFASLDEADKMIENAYKYGFVNRYQTKKKNEPWHFRYIGKVNARFMHDDGYTLDEYLSFLKDLKVNVLYTNGSDYIYKVKKNKVLIPKNYRYTLSSIDSNYYIVTFSNEKNIAIEKIETKPLKSYKINNINVSYDLILVNDKYKLEVNPTNKLVSLTDYLTKDNDARYVLEEKVLVKLAKLVDDASKLDRHTTYVTSAYRSKDEQKEIYINTELGYASKPGYSEHETGLAVDLSNSYKDIKYFNKTVQGRWISNNAHNYGFVLRYPFEFSDKTNISYEPWHFRYVGDLHANIMYENNLVLEDYLDMYELNKFYKVNFKKTNYIIYKTELKNNNIELINKNDSVYYLYDNYYLVISR